MPYQPEWAWASFTEEQLWRKLEGLPMQIRSMLERRDHREAIVVKVDQMTACIAELRQRGHTQTLFEPVKPSLGPGTPGWADDGHE